VPLVAWSPDSRRIFTFQQDARGVGNMYLVTTNVGTPQLQQWRYPLPGTRCRSASTAWSSTWSRRVTRLQMQPDPQRSTIYDHIAIGSRLVDVEWFPDGNHVAFVSTSRDAREVAFRVADASTGEVRTLFTETSPTQFQSGFVATGRVNWRLLPASNAVLWWSQRDNWGHLYLYDLRTGACSGRSRRAWNVTDVLHVDERARTLYFMGVGREPGRHPYFQHFYRVGWTGGPDADHAGGREPQRLAVPDRQHFVHTYSTPDAAAGHGAAAHRRAVVMQLERADISRLTATGWRPPTP
jgi:hypothetical protein